MAQNCNSDKQGFPVEFETSGDVMEPSFIEKKRVGLSFALQT